ncbi:MAG: hypothetical protein NZ699_09010 [Roseiflexus sp.]|nr:hypothetical protein [Roseiflexus sp.]MDW8148474.1 hypothetical protein [Roseiflexaceae bacterium]MDW8234745.1 hypothetical protein [Roseiflexaceae bacterium]
MYQFFLLVHVACFALWMGAVAASMLVVRTFEPRLTTNAGDVPTDATLLRAYIRREVKGVYSPADLPLLAIPLPSLVRVVCGVARLLRHHAGGRVLWQVKASFCGNAVYFGQEVQHEC